MKRLRRPAVAREVPWQLRSDAGRPGPLSLPPRRRGPPMFRLPAVACVVLLLGVGPAVAELAPLDPADPERRSGGCLSIAESVVPLSSGARLTEQQRADLAEYQAQTGEPAHEIGLLMLPGAGDRVSAFVHIPSCGRTCRVTFAAIDVESARVRDAYRKLRGANTSPQSFFGSFGPRVLAPVSTIGRYYAAIDVLGHNLNTSMLYTKVRAYFSGYGHKNNLTRFVYSFDGNKSEADRKITQIYSIIIRNSEFADVWSDAPSLIQKRILPEVKTCLSQ